MSEKTQRILEEIKLGTRKDTYDIEITVSEYLEKDENGISFLEHLFLNNIQINYRDELKFKNNIEIGYIYCKNNKSLYSFDFSEEDLFSNTNGKLFIEFILESGKIREPMIQKVENHIELVDMIISANEFYNLDYLSEGLVQKLITKDTNGLYPIEKYLTDEKLYKRLIPLINDLKVLTEICNKYHKIDWLKYANHNVLMLNTNENESVLKFLLNNTDIVPKVLESLPEDINFINFLRENNLYKYLTNTFESVFLLKIEPNKTLLEDLLEKGYKPKFIATIWEAETLKILNNTGNLQMVNETRVLDSLLLESAKNILKIEDDYNRTFLEYLLDNGYKPLKEHNSITNKEIIKILYNKGYYKLLGEKISEEGLLVEIEPNILIIDKLLENNTNINIGSFDSPKIARKLYDAKRFDLLAVGDIETLLINCDENNTYFDVVLESIKSREIIYSLTNYRIHPENFAKFYILIAKHDMMKYVNELKEEKLLAKYNEKTFVEELLDLDTDLTLNKILTEDLKSNPKISIILKSRGLDTKNIDLITNKPNFNKEYIDNINSTFGIGPLQLEGDFLLKKLEDLFINDGSSDPELISALVSGYRDALINNYEITIQELRTLVEIKTKNIERFCYIKEKDSGYFSSMTGSVHCDDSTISTLLHETGHALHYYLSDKKVPAEYEEIITKIRQNPQTIIKIEEYSKKFNELHKKTKSMIEEKYEQYFDSNSTEKEEEIIEFLNKTKEEQREEFEDLGISKETLDIILDSIFTKEEYINHQKRMFVKENVDAVLRSEFGAYISVGDIIDAIYDGDFHSGVLKNENGEKINPTYGHGIAYYFAREHGFDEMFANFSMILKSKDYNQVLGLLKDILGDDLYNMFMEFYNNNILNSNETELEGKKLL